MSAIKEGTRVRIELLNGKEYKGIIEKVYDNDSFLLREEQFLPLRNQLKASQTGRYIIIFKHAVSAIEIIEYL